MLLAAGAGLAFLLPEPSAEDADTAPRASTICLDCHEGYDAGLARTPHHLDAAEGPESAVACTDCHGGDARHYEEDPALYPMLNPSTLGADTVAVICAACHVNSHQQNMEEKNVHLLHDVSCTACHGVHESVTDGLLRAAEPGLCVECHQSAEGAFAAPYRHPVYDGVMTCSDCHQTLDVTRRDLSLNGTNVCMGCHAEFKGPFPFEHQATVDYSTEEGACITCHAPHGSAQPRMLLQPYEPPHYQLCSSCHAVPLHNQNTFHGTTWAGVPCNDCHTDIHGSYENRNFLSPALQGQGCFNSGCHNY
jgi:DmsE family decaheme c-type cytochrome